MTNTEIIFAVVGACLTLIGIAVAGAQVWVAISANRQARLAQEAADHQRMNDDKRFALAICEPLATQEVHAILNKPSPSSEEMSFLQALYDLCDVKGAALLSDEVKGDSSIARPINAALEPVKAFLEQNGLSAETADLDTKLGQVDHSKYSWEGEGRHSKIWTVNLLARRWLDGQPAITTREDFEKSFEAELRAAVPERAEEFNADWLLTDDPSQKYLPSLLLDLDGKKYGIHWRCGFRNNQIGTGVHKPIIQHFRERHDFPVRPL
jgi:hypothetical protein